jgi:hypothetical protein
VSWARSHGGGRARRPWSAPVTARSAAVSGAWPTGAWRPRQGDDGAVQCRHRPRAGACDGGGNAAGVSVPPSLAGHVCDRARSTCRPSDDGRGTVRTTPCARTCFASSRRGMGSSGPGVRCVSRAGGTSWGAHAYHHPVTHVPGQPCDPCLRTVPHTRLTLMRPPVVKKQTTPNITSL